MRLFTSSFVAAVLLTALSAGPAVASCIRSTPAELRARADVIFDGRSLEGPTATGVQRFRVIRYLKGTGPRFARVRTGVVRRADGSGTITSVSVLVERGQRWRIFAEGSPPAVVRTSACAGSRKM